MYAVEFQATIENGIVHIPKTQGSGIGNKLSLNK